MSTFWWGIAYTQVYFLYIVGSVTVHISIYISCMGDWSEYDCFIANYVQWYWIITYKIRMVHISFFLEWRSSLILCNTHNLFACGNILFGRAQPHQTLWPAVQGIHAKHTYAFSSAITPETDVCIAIHSTYNGCAVRFQNH